MGNMAGIYKANDGGYAGKRFALIYDTEYEDYRVYLFENQKLLTFMDADLLNALQTINSITLIEHINETVQDICELH